MHLPLAAFLILTSNSIGAWVSFRNESTLRLVADPGVGLTDPDEKSYAWGDLDRDGDVDLVVVRKQSWAVAGRRPNVLFLNEGMAEGHAIDGVLVDRTRDLASAATDGAEGFLDATVDRAAVLADLDNDGWLDLVTAVTLGDGLPKRFSHPRVYRNLGLVANRWAGLLHDEAAIPHLFAVPGGPSEAPRFGSVAVGDVDGDGRADFYFGNDDSGPGVIADLQDRLLINNGEGAWVDSVDTRVPADLLAAYRNASVALTDMNGDGWNDIIKIEAGASIQILYNNPQSPGSFSRSSIAFSGTPLYLAVNDWNGDDRPDLTVTDAGVDRLLLNLGTGVDGAVRFAERLLVHDRGFDDGSGGQSVAADLDLDGRDDLLITDVDAEFPGCTRRLHMYRNLGGPDVRLEEQGAAPWTGLGVHHVAVFDLSGDGWPDLVLGTCRGTEIWINQPPSLASFRYPDGLPDILFSDRPRPFRVQILPINGSTWRTATCRLHLSRNGGPFVEQALVSVSPNSFEGQLPAADCTSSVRWYLSARSTDGIELLDPTEAPSEVYESRSGSNEEMVLIDELEMPNGWYIEDSTVISGWWEWGDPRGTVLGNRQASPDDDATRGREKRRAFVTGNGHSDAGLGDLDGGPTRLISPPINLVGRDALVGFSYWFFCDNEGTGNGDHLTVAISADSGLTWVSAMTLSESSSEWRVASMRVSDYVQPGPQTRIRWSVADQPNNSITEAAVDDLRVVAWNCDRDQPVLVSSVPTSGAIDARQPYPPNGGQPVGWDAMTLSFSASVAPVQTDDIEIVVSSGSVPLVRSVSSNQDPSIQVLLDRPIPPGAWTRLSFRSYPPIRWGFLPGDVIGDGLVHVGDITALVEFARVPGTKLSNNSVDLDRSGAFTPLDIIRGMDILVGAQALDPWLGRSLP